MGALESTPAWILNYTPGVDPGIHRNQPLPLRIHPPPLFVIMWGVFGSQNPPLPPRIYSLFQQIYICDPPKICSSLQEYTPFLATMCDPRKEKYPSVPEYTPFSTTIILWQPPRIYPSLTEYTTLFNNYMPPSQNIPLHPRKYPSPSQQFYKCDPPRIYHSLLEYTSFEQL